jgi:hypothetical protein
VTTIWLSHQVCERCGWAGTTAAHRRVVASMLTYILTFTLLIVLDRFGVLDFAALVAAPMAPLAIGALTWFYMVPPIIWRWNKCGGCQQPMEPKLVFGRAPKPLQVSVETASAANRG